METTVIDTINDLKSLSIERLRTRYRELFGEESATRHRDVLIRRIAWRMQSLSEGGLSERARQRAGELARDADIRVLIPRTLKPITTSSGTRSIRDQRLPGVGTVLRREYAGKMIEVAVLDDGFEHDGHRYGSLSAIAARVTGTRWNGFLFFGLTTRARHRKGHSR